LLYIALAIAVVAAFLPLAWMLSTSFKPEGEILSYPPQWIPGNPTLENFGYIFSNFPFAHWGLNSIIVATVATFLAVLFDSLAGFAFAQLRFAGKRMLFAVIVAMLMVPIEVTIIPLYLFFAKIRLLDTLPALILPTTADVLGVYILTLFFRNLPRELIDAAVVDGAGFFRIWRSIALPLARPSLVVVAVITFVSSWNNLLWPIIAVNSDASRTLPVGLAQFFGGQSGVSGSAPQFGPAMAAALTATLPVIIIFLLLQRYFVRGIASSGLKG
jgi:ABC-type glycerol-3-phosphate transport system permease component